MGLLKISACANIYEFGKQLGSGNFAVVKKATRKTDGEGNIAKGKVVAGSRVWEYFQLCIQMRENR